MKDINILDNPNEFFDSLSTEEFKNLLDEFGFEYEDISSYNNEVKTLKKYIQNIKIKIYKSRKEYINFYKLNSTSDIKVSINTTKMEKEYFEQLLKFKSQINSNKKISKAVQDDEYDWSSVELGAAQR